MQRYVEAVIVSAAGPLGYPPGIDAVPTAYLVQRNCDQLASCIYRQGKDKHGYRSSINLTRFSNLPKICVALTSTTGWTRVAQRA